jgi:hypothetical protein
MRLDRLRGPAAYLSSMDTGPSSATSRAERIFGMPGGSSNPGYAGGSLQHLLYMLVGLSRGRILVSPHGREGHPCSMKMG